MSINNLYNRALQGNRDDENCLFQALTVRFRVFALHKIGNNEDAEEIVQSALLVIFQEYKTLEIETSFSAWAYKVLEYRLLNFLNKEKRHSGKQNQIRERLYGGSKPGNGDPDDIKDSLIECLRKICRANIRYARILNMHYQGYAVDEICRKIKISSANFYTILSRARSLLEICLEKGNLS